MPSAPVHPFKPFVMAVQHGQNQELLDALFELQTSWSRKGLYVRTNHILLTLVVRYHVGKLMV